MKGQYEIDHHHNQLISNHYIFKNFPNLNRMELSVMIIDDSKRDMDLACELLSLTSKLKCSIHKYLNSRNALSDLENDKIRPDVIILDLVMPCSNGLMVLDQLNEMGIADKIPVIINSSMNNYKNIMKVSGAGAHAFFVKPLNIVEFENYILGQDL